MKNSKIRKALGVGLDLALLGGVVVSAVSLGMEIKEMLDEARFSRRGTDPEDDELCQGCETFADMVKCMAEHSDNGEEIVGEAIEALVEYAEEQHMTSIIDFDAEDGDEGRCEFDPSKECCAFGCKAFERDEDEMEAGPEEQAQADGQEV